MFLSVLTFHIVVAIVMGGVALFSFWAMWKGNTLALHKNAGMLAYLFLLEAASGAMLGIMSPYTNPVTFCMNFLLYMTAFCLVELAIFFALAKGGREFPFALTFRMSLYSLGVNTPVAIMLFV